MDQCDLAPDQPTYEDIRVVADRSRHREDLMTLRMRPPAPANGAARDDFRQRRDGPVRSLEHDAMLTNERESLA